MPLLEQLELETLTPAGLWAKFDGDTRRLAAESLYRGERQDAAARQEADAAIAAAIRFRLHAVRKLPAERRIGYLLQRVQPDHSLASTLILALHLERRAPVLEAFLGSLEIPNEGGVIDERHDLETFDAERLAPAVDSLYEQFPQVEVETYLASLIALDSDSWSGLIEVLRRRAG